MVITDIIGAIFAGLILISIFCFFLYYVLIFSTRKELDRVSKENKSLLATFDTLNEVIKSLKEGRSNE